MRSLGLSGPYRHGRNGVYQLLVDLCLAGLVIGRGARAKNAPLFAQNKQPVGKLTPRFTLLHGTA